VNLLSGVILMFVGRFLAAKFYSLLFVLVRGSSFWTGVVADIPFLCLLSLSLHLLNHWHYSWIFFKVRSVMFNLGAFIATNVELRGIVHEITT